MKKMLTLSDLHVLCDHYVPKTSRHDASLAENLNGEVPQLWWPAHELGHLLTVPRKTIGKRQFGMQVDLQGDYSPEANRQRNYEVAAMFISRSLLIAAGREDLTWAERRQTSWDILHHHDYRSVERILQRAGCLRLPHTRTALERKIQTAFQ
jgi:Zn-dependent peptidase ImmA (M78 family)